jgi:hypothetical protein
MRIRRRTGGTQRSGGSLRTLFLPLPAVQIHAVAYHSLHAPTEDMMVLRVAR